MGSRYQTNTASGFDSSPPADDGSQTASNLVTWAGVKTKLASPVKTLADDINTDLLTAFDYSVRQITASDSVAASDHMRTVEIAASVSSTAVSVTLADAATMTSNFIVRIRNSSIINQTIARATGADTIDGTAANITLPPKASIVLSTTAAADGYLTVSYTGPKLDTDPLVTGSADGTKKVRLEVDGLTTATTRVVTVPDRNITIGDLSSITNSLSGNVALNNTSNYFDGPSVAQGTSGTWWASGSVNLYDTAGGAIFYVKLWDGTSVIASAQFEATVASKAVQVALSGVITSPAGNIRISVKDVSSTSGVMAYNASGNSKDSTVSAIRVA